MRQPLWVIMQSYAQRSTDSSTSCIGLHLLVCSQISRITSHFWILFLSSQALTYLLPHYTDQPYHTTSPSPRSTPPSSSTEALPTSTPRPSQQGSAPFTESYTPYWSTVTSLSSHITSPLERQDERLLPMRRRNLHHAPPKAPRSLYLPLQRVQTAVRLCIWDIGHLPGVQPAVSGDVECLFVCPSLLPSLFEKSRERFIGSAWHCTRFLSSLLDIGSHNLASTLTSFPAAPNPSISQYSDDIPN